MCARDAQAGESGSDPGASPVLSRGPRVSASAEFELRCLRRLSALTSQFREGQDVAKVLRATLRAGLELLDAQEGCVAILDPGKQRVETIFTLPQNSSWDREFLTHFIHGSENPIPAHLTLGRLRRRQRMWGILAVRAAGARFIWDHREALSALAAVASEVVERIDQERSVEARKWLTKASQWLDEERRKPQQGSASPGRCWYVRLRGEWWQAVAEALLTRSGR